MQTVLVRFTLFPDHVQQGVIHSEQYLDVDTMSQRLESYFWLAHAKNTSMSQETIGQELRDRHLLIHIDTITGPVALRCTLRHVVCHEIVHSRNFSAKECTLSTFRERLSIGLYYDTMCLGT